MTMLMKLRLGLLRKVAADRFAISPFQPVIKRPMISALTPELLTANSLDKNLSCQTVER